MFGIILRVMFFEKVHEVVGTFVKIFTVHALSENDIAYRRINNAGLHWMLIELQYKSTNALYQEHFGKCFLDKVLDPHFLSPLQMAISRN